MASAISAEPNDRASLSTWRTIGSTLASLVIGAGTPLVAYVTVDGNPVLSGSRMTIIAGIFSVIVRKYISCHPLHSKHCKEQKQCCHNNSNQRPVCNLCASGRKTGSQIWKERTLCCSMSDRCGQLSFVSDHSSG